MSLKNDADAPPVTDWAAIHGASEITCPNDTRKAMAWNTISMDVAMTASQRTQAYPLFSGLVYASRTNSPAETEPATTPAEKGVNVARNEAEIVTICRRAIRG